MGAILPISKDKVESGFLIWNPLSSKHTVKNFSEMNWRFSSVVLSLGR